LLLMLLLQAKAVGVVGIDVLVAVVGVRSPPRCG